MNRQTTIGINTNWATAFRTVLPPRLAHGRSPSAVALDFNFALNRLIDFDNRSLCSGI
jgi:hypothetical protein